MSPEGCCHLKMKQFHGPAKFGESSNDALRGFSEKIEHFANALCDHRKVNRTC